jgi:hypothetical protein
MERVLHSVQQFVYVHFSVSLESVMRGLIVDVRYNNWGASLMYSSFFSSLYFFQQH